MPFLQFDREIGTVICRTNAIESINARLRRAVNACWPLAHRAAAMKCLYLAIMRSLDPTGKGRKRWTNWWKAALKRVRHHLRGPPQRAPELTTKISYTVKWQSLKR